MTPRTLRASPPSARYIVYLSTCLHGAGDAHPVRHQARPYPCPVQWVPIPTKAATCIPGTWWASQAMPTAPMRCHNPPQGRPLVESQADGAYRERRKERKKHDRNRLGSPAEWVAWLPNGQSVMLTASAVSLRSLALSPFPVAVSLFLQSGLSFLAVSLVSGCLARAMSSHDPAEFWGTLINADKSPSPRLEQLCLGIAQVMVRSPLPRGSECIETPSNRAGGR